jgi:long-chain acyl-CoA synthetase
VQSSTPIPRETLPALVRRSLADGREAVLVERAGDLWKPTSAAQLLERIRRIAAAIRGAGLSGGDRVALIASDCVNWIVADFATLFAGCVVVPIFPTQADDQVAYILRNSEARLIFVDKPLVAAHLAALGIAPGRVVVFESGDPDSLAAFESEGETLLREHRDWPECFEREIDPGAMAVLIYTSGTTGEPKGVMLSHFNVGFTAQASFYHAFTAIAPESDVLSVLPFSHIYEHSIIYGYMISRVHHYISHSADDLLDDLKYVRPVVMTAVPRIFERMIAGITAKSKVHGGLQARVVPWALDAGRRYMSAKIRGQAPPAALALQYRIAHLLVLRKLRPLLGLDRLQFLVSGSAPLHFDIAMTMLGAGIPVVEGYGPTECSPVITVNTPAENHYGTVGRPIPGVEIRIADDGEILARGPNVMLGYYKNEAATAEALAGGWYHTGDIGSIDDHGYLRVTDRKKELFKTSGGKFIAPARVEAAIKRSVYVNQVMLVGDGRPHPAALISPNWNLVRSELRIDPSTPIANLIGRSDVVAFLTKEVRENTADLARFEQVWRIAILPRELRVEEGDLSPTLKVRRRVVESRFAELIERLYAQEDDRQRELHHA